MGCAMQYSPLQHAINLLLATTSFYLAQWEEYRTHNMFLGYVNVTEALVMSELLLLFTAWKGPLYFVTSGLRDIMFVVVVLAAIGGDCVYVYNTVRATRVRALHLRIVIRVSRLN